MARDGIPRVEEVIVGSCDVQAFCIVHYNFRAMTGILFEMECSPYGAPLPFTYLEANIVKPESL